MITIAKNEVPFQILSSCFTIGPSETGYELQVGADSRNFSTLFSVGANTPRMVTNVANGSYFRLKNNVGDVKVNWERSCSEGGGGGASGTELQPVSEFPYDATDGTVVAYTGSSSASGVYQYDGTDWVPVGVDDLSAYWTSAQTKTYVDSAVTAVEDHLFDVEEVTASALTELHTGLLEVSARTVDMSGYYTSAQTDSLISAATSGKADAASVTENRSASRWPAWNSQGIITGTVGNPGFESSLIINGKQYWLWRDGSEGNMGSIYAPKTAGSAGQILTPSGNTPVWVTPATINGSAITAGGNIEIQGGGSSDMTQLQPVSELPESAETGTVMALVGEGLPAGFTFVLGTGLGYNNDRSGGTLTVANNAALGVDSANPIYLFSVNGVNVYAWECEWDSRGISLCFGEPDNYLNLIDMAPEAEGAEWTDVLGDGSVDANYVSNSSNPGYIQIYNAENEAEPVFELPAGDAGLYQYDGSDWASVTMDMSAYYTSAQTEQAITSKNYVTSAQVETQITGKNYVTSAQVETQITGKGYATTSDIPTSNSQLSNDEDYVRSYNEPGVYSFTRIENVMKISQSEYDDLVNYGSPDGNTLYIVVPDSI